MPGLDLLLRWWLEALIQCRKFAHRVVVQRKADAQPRAGGGAEADDVLLSVTVIMPDSAAVASSVWFSDQNVHNPKSSGQLALGLAVTAGVVTAPKTKKPYR